MVANIALMEEETPVNYYVNHTFRDLNTDGEHFGLRDIKSFVLVKTH